MLDVFLESEGKAGANPNEIWNFKEFKTQLQKKFEDVAEQKKARSDLDTMRQGKETVQDYLDKFDQLARLANFDDDCMHIALAESCINTLLLEKLYRMETVPVTWEEWCKKAILFDDQWRRLQEIKKGKNPSYSAQKKGNLSKPFGVTSGAGVPMDINAQKAQMKCHNCSKLGHLAKECHRPPTCFNCGKPGHLLAACKAPKKARKAGGGSTTGYKSTASASGSAHPKGKSVRTS